MAATADRNDIHNSRHRRFDVRLKNLHFVSFLRRTSLIDVDVVLDNELLTVQPLK